jgi:hypothetical protein
MIPRIPPPTSFAEGQRLIYGWLAAAAGMFSGAVAIGLIAVLVWGGWPTSLYGQIVTILGIALGGFIACMAAVMIGLLVGGPVGRFKGSVTKEGATFEADGDPAPTSTKVTVETPAPKGPTE